MDQRAHVGKGHADAAPASHCQIFILQIFRFEGFKTSSLQSQPLLASVLRFSKLVPCCGTSKVPQMP